MTTAKCVSGETLLDRWVDRRITLGNILTIAILFIGGLWGYSQLTYQVSMLTRALEEHKSQQVQEYQRRDVQETRNRFIDKQMSDIEGKIDTILSKMDKK